MESCVFAGCLEVLNDELNETFLFCCVKESLPFNILHGHLFLVITSNLMVEHEEYYQICLVRLRLFRWSGSKVEHLRPSRLH